MRSIYKTVNMAFAMHSLVVNQSLSLKTQGPGRLACSKCLLSIVSNDSLLLPLSLYLVCLNPAFRGLLKDLGLNLIQLL